jgi:four helix bundle protein
MGKSIIADKSFDFALDVIKTYKWLVKEKKEFVLSKQFLRSGTAVGALVREAQNAESKKDFIHKLAIAQKECDETIYWIELLKESQYLDIVLANELIDQSSQLLKMIRSAIMSSKKNL